MITGPDSAAQISIQAAEYVRRYGALVPFDISPPLLPLLIAALALAGIPETTGYFVIALTAYLGGCAAVYALVLRYQSPPVAAFAALLYALAPTRMPPASFEHGSLLLSWSFAPLLLFAVDSARRNARPGNVAAAIAAAAGMWAANPSGVSTRELVALAELVLVVFVCLLQGAIPRQVVLAGFAAVAGWTLFLEPSPEPVRSRLASLAPRDAVGREIFGAASLAVEMNPVRASARDVVAGPGRLEESMLWLRATAAGFLLSGDHEKFSRALDCIEEQAGWCLYVLPNPNPAPVVLVSRRQWKSLPPIRGLYDVESLNQYAAWAGRPEAAAFEEGAGAAFEVAADLGPLDMFLIRRNCQPGWRALVVNDNSREVPIECDPLGFMVVDPGREGETQVRLEFEPSWRQRFFPESPNLKPLTDGQFPRIAAAGIVEAAGFQRPPFQPGASLSIFGHNFVPGDTRVLFGETPGEVSWIGPQQINVRLPPDVAPGELNVVVESAGRESFAETIEIGK